jgi:hypothetical protein
VRVHPPGSLLGLLLTDDIGDDLDCCEEVLAGVTAVRTGSRPRFEYAWNATRLVIEPAGVHLRWAMRVSSNAPERLTLDELTAALEQLRRVLGGA